MSELQTGVRTALLPAGRRPQGFTLIEVTISMVLMTMVLLVVSMVLQTTSENLGFELTVTDQQIAARSVLDNAMDELRHIRRGVADFDTGVPTKNDTVAAAETTRHALVFCIPSYDTATHTVQKGDASNAITYRWVVNPKESDTTDGVDNDGNGLVDLDDGRIERLVGGVGGSTQVLLDHVPEGGFVVRKIGPRLEITIARKNDTRRITADNTFFTTTITQITYTLKNP